MKREKVSRIGVSLPPNLLKKFDTVIKKRTYKNRSQAIRDAIRGYILRSELKIGKGMRIGIISLIYSHHTRKITDTLTDIQHNYHNIIKSNIHLHLDEENCMELIILEGDAQKIKKIKNKLTAVSGVKYSDLMITKILDY